MRSKTCCFTGHRDIPANQRGEISERLEKALVSLINDGFRYFGAGGAIGFDTLAAQTVLKLKKSNPGIFLILVLPCKDQTNKWNNDDIEEYEKIKKQADKIVYTSEFYTRGCMHKRNRHLVENSSACIYYLTKTSGGTAYTVNYAKRKGLKMIPINV